MARPLRIAYPGALYHVTSRGNAQQRIVEDQEDRHAFVAVLGAVVRRYNWLCHAYCLMDNHYHLVIEPPDGNLPRGMRQLNGVYTQRFNRHHGRVGHVFQGRYKAIVIDRDSYLLEVCRYVVLHPVRAGLAQLPSDYPWSSYRATAGLEYPVTLRRVLRDTIEVREKADYTMSAVSERVASRILRQARTFVEAIQEDVR